MATEHRWQGATGTWQLAGNWDSGEIPSVHDSTDNAVFSDLSQQSVDGVDLTGAFPLKRIVTRRSYTGDIGAEGSPLHCTMASVGDVLSRVIHRGSGRFYFKGDTGNFADVLVDSRNATDAFFADGTIRNFYAKSGFGKVVASGSVVGYVVCDGPSAHIVIANTVAASSPEFIIVVAGVLENKRITLATTKIVVMGGHLIQTGPIRDGTDIFIGPEGRMTYDPNVTLTTANDNVDLSVFGSMDISQSAQDIQFDNMLIGVGAGMLGTPVQSGQRSPLSTNIDLREEYP